MKPSASRFKGRHTGKPQKQAGSKGPGRKQKARITAAKPPAKRSAARIRTMTRAEISRRLESQKLQRKTAREHERAAVARDKFRPGKADRGKLVMISTAGKRDPQHKGHKGYLTYVTKTGKVWLVKQKGNKDPFKPRKITDVEPPLTKNLRKAAKQFQAARREIVSEHRAAVKGSTSVTTGGANDFNAGVVDKLARSLKRTIEKQASHRSFIINANILVKLPSGENQVVNIMVPIDKADNIAIEIGGLRNFISQKFYAFMARELAYLGLVTAGSANHVRRLAENKGAYQGELTKGGQNWVGNDLEICHLHQIEWRIEQAK